MCYGRTITVLVLLALGLGVCLAQTKRQPSNPSQPSARPQNGVVVDPLLKAGIVSTSVRRSGTSARFDSRRGSAYEEPIAQWRVESRQLHPSESAAEEDALSVARDQVVSYLRAMKPDSQWTPSLSFVREKMVRDQPMTVAVALEEPVDKVMYRTRLEIVLMPSVRDQLVRKLRLEEAEGRQWVFTKWMLGVLATFSVVGGYYRLEDYTKGYVTLWLRLGAAGVLTVAVIFISRFL